MKVVLSLAGIVAIALAMMYFTLRAGSLPLPDALGHQTGSATLHVKHGVAALIAGLACFILALRKRSPQ